jgi:shikimate dehydrogenase
MNDVKTRSPQAQALIDGSTKLYGIIGHPIEQVKSPLVFNPRFKAAGLNAVLVPLDVLPEAFETTVRGLMALANLGGLIVTVPYKVRAMALVDEILPTGRTVGAINAMRRRPGGGWAGDMFDGRGLVAGLAAEGLSVAGRRVLLIGTGGAGSAVAVAFAEAGAAAIMLHDLDEAKAAGLAARTAKAYPGCAVAMGRPIAAGHDVIVNATPIGMAADDGLPAAIGRLDPNQLVIDVIAKPEVTPLLAAAKASGCRTIGGKTMLAGQTTELENFLGIGG